MHLSERDSDQGLCEPKRRQYRAANQTSSWKAAIGQIADRLPSLGSKG